ncbi:hypothetical protein ACWGPC_58600, partial [Streptomyces mirabilis]
MHGAHLGRNEAAQAEGQRADSPEPAFEQYIGVHHDLAIMRVDARRQGKRHGLEAVPLIVEVVSVSFARKDYEYCTEKHGCY